MPLSGITAATGSNAITGNANYMQTWSWGTLGGNTALALTSTDMTSGTILEIENTYGGNSTGYMVFLEDVTTGAGYALYSLTTGNANTGYAGYFVNTATSGANYALYVTSSTQASAYGVYSALPQASNTGYAGYFSNSGTGAAYGVYGTSVGTANTGYAGYFTNTATSGANYAVYGTDASSSGYGGYFANSSAGWALNVTGTSYFNGRVGIGTPTPNSALTLYTTTTGGLGFTMNNAASGGAEWEMIVADNDNSAEAGSLNFVANGNSSSQGALAITTSDWVGISNTGYASIPISMLDIVGNSDTRITVQSSDMTGGNYTGFQLEAGSGSPTFEGGILIPNNNKSLVELWSR